MPRTRGARSRRSGAGYASDDGAEARNGGASAPKARGDGSPAGVAEAATPRAARAKGASESKARGDGSPTRFAEAAAARAARAKGASGRSGAEDAAHVRAIAVAAACTVAHTIAIGVVPHVPREVSPWLAWAWAATPAPPGFSPGDVGDLVFAVLLAVAQMRLLATCLPAYRPPGGGGTSAAQTTHPALALHGVLAALMVAGAGAHSVANSLDEAVRDSDAGPRAPAMGRYDLLYWTHEYFAHRVFYLSNALLWAHAAYWAGKAKFLRGVELGVGTATGIFRASRLLLFCSVIHTIVITNLSVGTRTVDVVAPISVIMLINVYLAYKNSGGHSIPELSLYVLMVAGGSLMGQAMWAATHDWSLPTFDDLRMDNVRAMELEGSFEEGWRWGVPLFCVVSATAVVGLSL